MPLHERTVEVHSPLGEGRLRRGKHEHEQAHGNPSSNFCLKEAMAHSWSIQRLKLVIEAWLWVYCQQWTTARRPNELQKCQRSVLLEFLCFVLVWQSFPCFEQKNHHNESSVYSKSTVWEGWETKSQAIWYRNDK